MYADDQIARYGIAPEAFDDFGMPDGEAEAYELLSHGFESFDPRGSQAAKHAIEAAELKDMLGLRKLPDQSKISEDEWEQFSTRIKSGDHEAKQELVERRLRTMYGLAKWFAAKSGNTDRVEDIFQDEYIYVTRRLNSFHLSELPLREYFSLVMFGGVTRAKSVRRDSAIPIRFLANTADPSEPLPAEIAEEREDARILHAVMDAVLLKRPKDVLALRWGLGEEEEATVKEIQKMLHISRSTVHNDLDQALDMITPVLEQALFEIIVWRRPVIQGPVSPAISMQRTFEIRDAREAREADTVSADT
jgi:RNA polymerase sigma factor (sigma-70 family)